MLQCIWYHEYKLVFCELIADDCDWPKMIFFYDDFKFECLKNALPSFNCIDSEFSYSESAMREQVIFYAY